MFISSSYCFTHYFMTVSVCTRRTLGRLPRLESTKPLHRWNSVFTRTFCACMELFVNNDFARLPQLRYNWTKSFIQSKAFIFRRFTLLFFYSVLFVSQYQIDLVHALRYTHRISVYWINMNTATHSQLNGVYMRNKNLLFTNTSS